MSPEEAAREAARVAQQFADEALAAAMTAAANRVADRPAERTRDYICTTKGCSRWATVEKIRAMRLSRNAHTFPTAYCDDCGNELGRDVPGFWQQILSAPGVILP